LTEKSLKHKEIFDMDLKTLLGDAFKEGMTLADIEAALKDRNLVDPSTLPKSVTKETFDKTAHELAEANKKLAAKQTDDEKAQAAQAEIQEKLASLEKENGQYRYEKQFLASGYDGKTAAALAEAMAGGDMVGFTKIHGDYAKAHETELRASIKDELMKATPGLQGGGAGGAGGAEQSLGAKMAQSYNQQYAPAPAAGAPTK
jgi:nanoRNase/pAp phosphatase (c-di-AMP/oligoRNAs hydrolase)